MKYTKGHGKLWKKGQSSSHNPSFSKFRDQAKKRGMTKTSGNSNLTEAMVAQHNRITTSAMDDENDDAMTVGGDTVLTAFTNCSLPTFTRLLKNWNSRSFLHKEMVAVLAAVTELLQKDGGNETETDYFAALMTTLDVVDSDESVTAVISLLAMLVNKVNESVLRAQSKKTCETMVKLLVKYMNSDQCILLRNLLTIMDTFLKLRTHWPETCDDLNVCLEFATHPKPKVRKKAKHIIRTLLTEHVPENASFHPAADLVAGYCVKRLESSTGKTKLQDLNNMLHVLQDIFPVLPSASVKKCAETVLKVMTLSDTTVVLCGLNSLEGLFNAQPKITPQLNGQIIKALYSYQPNFKDSHCINDWIRLMYKAFRNLYSLDKKSCVTLLPDYFSETVKFWLSDVEGVKRMVEDVLKGLIEDCVLPSKELFIDETNTSYNSIVKLFHPVNGALSYQYNNAWNHVFNVLSVFFKVAGNWKDEKTYETVMECLGALADLHDSYNFPYVSALEDALGAAIQHLGPKRALKKIKWTVTDIEKNRKSWMLPLLRNKIKKTELKFFITEFLPMAKTFLTKASALNKEGKVIESKLYDTLCSQVWSLLPGFCNEPTDLKESLKDIAEILGNVLKSFPSLRAVVLRSLQLLIEKNENEDNRQVIAIYAKNYLPILFNLYSTEPKDKADNEVRPEVYQTIKLFITITDKELCSKFFGIAVEIFKSSESEIFMLHAMLDICKAMVPYIDEIQIQELFEFCKSLLQHSNHTIKKKAYGALNEICHSASEDCRQFIKSHLEELRVLLSGNVGGLTPATRALRLGCLQRIVSQLTEVEKSTLVEIIPEAVLCTKENSDKARKAASQLLVEIGQALKRFRPEAPKDAVKEYLTYLLPGLATRPHFVSATILAIVEVMYHFRDEMDSQIIENLIENMCQLIKAKSREIVISVLSFFKQLFKTVPTTSLAQHVPTLVSSLTCISSDSQRPFRFNVKKIFTRLVRKFGHEMISKLVPKEYQKQLSNIRKIEARKHRGKNSKFNDSDSEAESYQKKDEFDDLLADSDDDEVMDEEKKVPQKRKKKTARCIEEKPLDIVDLLDPAANKKLLTVKTKKADPEIVVRDDFPVSSDGRLIITQLEDDKRQTPSVKKDISVLAELEAFKSKKRKLKDSDEESDFEGGQSSKSTVKTGIFRSGPPQSKKKGPGEEFRAKKARGDVKKGKLEPFAYLPLNRQALNKRKQGKLKGQFKNIVRAAKRGAQIGNKKKARHGKKGKN